MQTESTDYFVNHSRARKFPWSLYHGPLERDLIDFVETASDRKPNAELLVIGCGLMQELDQLPADLAITLIDIDERALRAVSGLGDARIKKTVVVEPTTDLRTLGKRFDAIYAKEVIEHVLDTRSYLEQLRDILNPNGAMWLSTPNYGELWLPLIENTFLELVARYSGYTRKGIHPSQFSRASLEAALKEVGLKNVSVRPVSQHLALVARATR